MITFRLADSLPRYKVQELAAAKKLGKKVNVDNWLDAGHGACWLKRREIAELVQETLMHFDGTRYQLMAWVIMPNHVHVLVQLFREFTLAKVVLSWKSYTARRANVVLGSSGRFWIREYFDRYIRDEDHLRAAAEYIEFNPVKAGLVGTPDDWPYSSAVFERKMPR